MEASTTTQLPIRPRPNPREESLTSYCLRVSDANDYRTPRQLLAIAGISDPANLFAGAVDKLASLLDIAPAVLEDMAVVRLPGGREEKWQRAQQRYRAFEISPSLTRICPECVKELGYARAIWDIRLVVACPRHKTRLLGTCPTCERPLTWERRGLLTCDCGQRLGEEPQPSAPEWVVRVASLIEHSMYGNRPAHELTWCPREIQSMPVEELLPFLTYLVALLGGLASSDDDGSQYFRMSFDVVGLTDPLNTVGRAIAEWPLSHARAIATAFERRGHQASQVGQSKFRDALGMDWIWAQSRSAPPVLRNEIKTYLAERIIYQGWIKTGYLHPRHIIPFTLPSRSASGINLEDGAELLGISTSLFLKLAANGVLKKFDQPQLVHRGTLFDVESVLALNPLISTTCTHYEAAFTLAVSVAQLGELMRHGLLEVKIGKRKSAVGGRFLKDDLIGLNSRFAELAHRVEDDVVAGHRVRLEDFPISHGDKGPKREFSRVVQAILNGKLPIASSTAGAQGIGDYILDVNDLAEAGISFPRRWLLNSCRSRTRRSIRPGAMHVGRRP